MKLGPQFPQALLDAGWQLVSRSNDATACRRPTRVGHINTSKERAPDCQLGTEVQIQSTSIKDVLVEELGVRRSRNESLDRVTLVNQEELPEVLLLHTLLDVL